MNSSDQQRNSITYMEPKLYKAAEAGNINPFKDRLPTRVYIIWYPSIHYLINRITVSYCNVAGSSNQLLDKTAPNLAWISFPWFWIIRDNVAWRLEDKEIVV
jgi:hypothetical protein